MSTFANMPPSSTMGHIPTSAYKTIYIQHTSEASVEIQIPLDQQKDYTCHWLLQQAISKLKESFSNQERFNNIVALQTVNHEYAVDHWLTLAYKSVSVLKNGVWLKPFYKQVNKTDEDESKVILEDFIVETKLGYGAFSQVFLVRKKDTGALYALKQIKKGDFSRRKKKMLIREREAMLDITSSHVVPLRYSFQTMNHCYFVIDFVPCGDLHHIIVRRKLKEHEARFFVAETILALNAIHAEHYIYRDLKPENLLLDLDGHVRITDFGLAKRVGSIRDPNYSQCGTFEIMAPEVMTETGYNCMVDYYNIGTLTYELITGKVPVFTGKERLFLEESNRHMADLSEDLKDFLKKLLEPKPANRLGATRGLKEICAHAWLAPVNMSQLHQRKIRPPLLFDPASVKFKHRSIVDTNIDYVEPTGTPDDTDKVLPHFSFYGFGEATDKSIDTPDRVVSNKPVTSAKVTIAKLTALNSESGISRVSTGTELSATKITKVASDVRPAEEDDATEACEIDCNDSIAAKLANYQPINKKSMKIVHNFAKWCTSQKEVAVSDLL